MTKIVSPVFEVQESTTLNAFSTVKPDEEYTSERNMSVVYRCNVKFTVVLALSKKVKAAWSTAGSTAYQRIAHMFDNEFSYHRGNTLLVRRLSVATDQKYGEMIQTGQATGHTGALSVRLGSGFAAAKSTYQKKVGSYMHM
jgi:hypothetical protein